MDAVDANLRRQSGAAAAPVLASPVEKRKEPIYMSGMSCRIRQSIASMRCPSLCACVLLCTLTTLIPRARGFVIRKPEGECPRVISKIRCLGPPSNECADDGGCHWNMKCCFNGCNHICLKVSGGSPPIIPTKPPLFKPPFNKPPINPYFPYFKPYVPPQPPFNPDYGPPDGPLPPILIEPIPFPFDPYPDFGNGGYPNFP
ncbi:uncharacterized protein O3C94_011825 [Discoglossus pictus]